MSEQVYVSLLGAAFLLFVGIVTAVLTYNGGRVNRVIEQSKFWESQIPPIKKELFDAQLLTNQLMIQIADITARHTLELAAKEADHKLILAEREAQHVKEVSSKEAEIRRWTERVDKLEQRILTLESGSPTGSIGTISESTTITKPLSG